MGWAATDEHGVLMVARLRRAVRAFLVAWRETPQRAPAKLRPIEYDESKMVAWEVEQFNRCPVFWLDPTRYAGTDHNWHGMEVYDDAFGNQVFCERKPERLKSTIGT